MTKDRFNYTEDWGVLEKLKQDKDTINKLSSVAAIMFKMLQECASHTIQSESQPICDGLKMNMLPDFFCTNDHVKNIMTK